MFKIHSTSDGRVPPFEYLPAGAITPKVGMALYQSGGNLILSAGTNKPTYICMCERDEALTAGELIPVIRVEHDIIFETELSASGASLKLGDKVTVATDGLRVTATTTDGVAEVVAMEGTASGSEVLVRF